LSQPDCQAQVGKKPAYCSQQVFLDVKPKFLRISCPLLFDDYLLQNYVKWQWHISYKRQTRFLKSWVPRAR